VRVGVEAQLDSEDTPRRRARRVAKAVYKIQYWQDRRRQARRSHRKRTLRQLRKHGILISRCRPCVWTL